MSLLELYTRPLVAFDPSNRDHRKWFAEFQRTKCWGNAPVRFIVPDEHGDLISLVTNSLINYYVGKEFGKQRKKKVDKKVV